MRYATTVREEDGRLRFCAAVGRKERMRLRLRHINVDELDDGDWCPFGRQRAGGCERDSGASHWKCRFCKKVFHLSLRWSLTFTTEQFKKHLCLEQDFVMERERALL